MLFDSLISHPDVFQQKSRESAWKQQKFRKSKRTWNASSPKSPHHALFSWCAWLWFKHVTTNQWLRPGHPHLRLVRKNVQANCPNVTMPFFLLLRTTKTQVHIIAPQKTSFSVATIKVMKHDAWTCNSTPLKYLQIIYCPWSSSWFLL